MSTASKERRYYEKTDKNFRITLFLKKYRILENVAQWIFDIFCFISREIYSIGTKKNNGIVIIALHRLGDTVFCIPTIRLIISNYRDKNITIICFPETKPIIELKIRDINIITIDKNKIRLSRRIAGKKDREKVKALKPKIIFDLSGIPLSASLVYSVRSACKVGMNIPALRKLYHHFTYIREIPHFMDIYMDVAELIIPIENRKQHLRFPEFSNHDGAILVHPFAIRKAKEWSLNNYIRLVKKMAKNYRVKIVAPPGFISREIVKELISEGLDYIESKTITELIDIISKCSVFIGNDSGPVYIAALLGKPTFSIYGPTNPAYSFPEGGKHRFIQHKMKCSAKGDKFCYTFGGMFCPSQECLEALNVEYVYSEVVAFLKEININPKQLEQHILN